MRRGAESKARKCFELWNKALATKKADVVTERYRIDGNKFGVLVPTLSNEVRHDREGILDYFVEFLKKSPQGKIIEIYAKALPGGNVAASGLYNFDLTVDGKDSVFPARFTYVFTKNCKILDHHSSGLPE